jgi:hypothetical protein
MRRPFFGAVLVVAGIAAFIEAHSHHTAARMANEYNPLGQHITVEHAG